MFVNLLQRRVFEGAIAAFLRLSLLDFIEGGGPVLHELDAGELFQDPALRRVECKLGLLRLHSFVHCDDAVEFFDICAGINRHPFDQSQNPSSAVQWWPGEMLNLLHQNSSFSSLSSALRSPLLAGVMRCPR